MMLEPEYRLVTVNTAPERAKRVVGRIISDVKDRYNIIHVANVESEFPLLIREIDQVLKMGQEIEDVKSTVEHERPNLLFRSPCYCSVYLKLTRVVHGFHVDSWTSEGIPKPNMYCRDADESLVPGNCTNCEGSRARHQDAQYSARFAGRQGRYIPHFVPKSELTDSYE
jgi:hypothetical protein